MQPLTYSMLLLATLSISTLATSRFRPESDPNSEPETRNTNFIKTSCGATRYPDLCFKTLSPYAATVQTSPMELANAALSVSLEGAKRASEAVAEVSRGRELSRQAGAAVADCLENMGDSMDEMRKSMAAMKGLGGPGFTEKMGNVVTWVSAALTDEDTCMDGFEESLGKMKDTIRGYIVNVAELTSNALALISNISST